MIRGPSSSRNAVPANREVSPSGGGLELQREDGQWLSVPPVPDSLVVNIGDYMHLLTGGRFKTPYHRVTMPEAGGAGGADERTSFVFFAYPGRPKLLITPIFPIFSDFFPFSPGLLAVLPGFLASRR